MFGHDDNHEEEKHEDTQIDQTPHGSTSADDNWQHPGPPPSDDGDGQNDTGGSDEHQADTHEEKFSFSPTNPSSNDSSDHDSESSNDGSDSSTDDLIDIKQDALTKLSPLVGHLDQSPEEKFRTLMMMIQASDNQSLLKQAYDTALEIGDEKTKAQALLDVVNEINYFTQHPKAD